MKCRACKASIGDYAFFCPECGAQTPLIHEKLSARLILRESWAAFKTIRSHYYAFAIFYVIVILAPTLLAGLWLPRVELTGHAFTDYLLVNAALLLLVPLTLAPLTDAQHLMSGGYRIGDYLRSLRKYPWLLAFTLLNELYFFVLKYVCDGLPANDPILHLVRLVMVLYWLAIVMPAPVLMNHGLCPGKSTLAAWRGGKYTRWQQFFLLVIIAALNTVALIPVGLGLLVSIPFSFYLMIRFVQRQTEQHVYDGSLPGCAV